MERRDLLRAFGAATALALVPHDAVAAWARVASGLRPTGGLSDAQLALVGAIADMILPRTDTPSATDVGVPAFVDVIVTENYGDAERATFLAGLDAIDAQAKSAGGAAFVDLLPRHARRRSTPSRARAIDERNRVARTGGSKVSSCTGISRANR